MPKSTEDEHTPNPTGEEPQAPPAATDEKDGSPSASDEDRDKKNIVSQRDRANEELRKLQERLEELEGADLERAVRTAIESHLKDNKEKYPDVDVDDVLPFVREPDDIEKESKRLQDKYQTIRDKAISDIEVAREPKPLTPEEMSKKEDEIMKDEKITDKASAIFNLRFNQ